MAVTTVGELAVELEAQTQKFDAGMADVLRELGTFEKTAAGSTKRAGLAFSALLVPLAAIAGAIAAIGTAKILTDISQAAVASASAFEGYEVRLKSLLGSQEGANKALETFLELSSKTPFGLAELVAGGATIATVVKGSREEMEELSIVTANLAATFGLSFEEAASNMQRALSSGIGAADQFRDKGVRKMIEDVNGIPDLTKVSLDELRDLFKRTFEPGAVSGLGEAAINLSFTLAGALSNIGDSLERFRLALGKALSPAVIATARGVIIPFFDQLTGKVKESETSLQELFIEGFARGAEAIAEMIAALAPLAEAFGKTATKVIGLKDEAIAAFEGVLLFFKAISTGFQILGTGLNAIGAAARVLSFLVGARTAEEVEEQMDALFLSSMASVDAAKDLQESWEAWGKDSQDETEETTGRMKELEDAARAAGKTIRDLGAEEIRLAAERAAAHDEAAAAAQRRAREIANEIKAINAEFNELDREHRAAVLRGEFPELEPDVLPEAARLAAEEPVDLDELAQEFADIEFEHEKWLKSEAEKTGTETGRIFSSAMSDALSGLAEGQGISSFAEALSSLSADLLEESLSSVLDNLGESFAELLASLGEGIAGAFSGEGEGGGFLSGIFGGGDGGGIFGGGKTAGESGADWGAGAAAAIGLGGSILAGALQGTDVSVRNPRIRSAVTSTQALRGIVAGPSNIPIAQVGDAIRDAQGEQVAEIQTSNRLLERILRAVQAGGGEGAGTDIDAALADAIAGEFTGSVALG